MSRARASRADVGGAANSASIFISVEEDQTDKRLDRWSRISRRALDESFAFNLAHLPTFADSCYDYEVKISL
jgi:hypothetical protein